ncbi:MAG: aminotransferase class V-fold PLP-dependent enzyme [Mesorhizobium sp.]|uniref:cysteine desulfurase family protein n=1 Tax=Mesorhizobium sp. M00.F.Ca.ET.217.01.1.1 TaxID=2500529 RepID=UPI000FDC4259|nr:aminotransferase class V-fold PLP-dependent enzyme [Mesorhizobium sp. M00.F.Ca.ET.217.01.1.1]RWC99753.1 MAG: aminotransferase class V-fold PLP-dependent enzyme [Mesorhizobium sp.]TGQ19066.1 aminotransferase class V-fold PLP-dependent enzyme [Mesorhizobium sp. M00.F.Ca.ET.217.01.1.1]TGV89954.1 aminotransferase class V-fold PLP-dependent enzyme [Mesorhizobium sp. M00.F.Ca.ET.158.01.1.1]
MDANNKAGMTSFPGGIYLDHHATTPVDRRVADAVIRFMVEEFGNANSVDHVHGERAAAAVEAATDSVAQLFSAEAEDVLFTSGSTQALELAFAHAIGAQRDTPLRVALARVEHPAVIDIAKRAEQRGLARLRWLDVSSDASIDLSQMERLMPEIDLLCLMAANNEVGTVYPVADAYEMSSQAGVAMLVDATQAAGRIEIDLSQTPFDYLVLSGHKIYAPKGVGALISPIYRASDNHGIAGSHPATPNVPAIVGLGVACRLMVEQGKADEERIRQLRDLMWQELKSIVPSLSLNGGTPRLSGNLHVSAPGAPNDLVMSRLRGHVAISTGAACMSGAQGASHVLQAMKLTQDLQESALRIGLGRATSRDNVVEAAQHIGSAIAAVKTTLGLQHA